MTLNQKQHARLVRRGRVAEQRNRDAKAAENSARKKSKNSARRLEPADTTNPDTHLPSGKRRAVRLRRGKHPKAGRRFHDDVDWRYLSPRAQFNLTSKERWSQVLMAIRYYQSTFVDYATREQLEHTHDELSRQEGTV